MGKTLLFGGGRWGKILLTVLREILPSEEVSWITRHNTAEAKHWVLERGFKQVNVSEELPDDLRAFRAAIVATSPHSHSTYVQKCLRAGVPTLSEKPIALKQSEVDEILSTAKAMRTAIGINLEFSFASYLHDFADLIKAYAIQNIKVEWGDPWSEDRLGQKKFGDYGTEIVHDMLPHVLSIVRVILPDLSVDFTVARINSDLSVSLEGNAGEIVLEVGVSRRASVRTRRLVVDDGAFEIDFSEEPGSIKKNGIVLQQNEWKSGRPLGQALSSFYEIVQNPVLYPHWQLSLLKNVDSVLATIKAAELAMRARDIAFASLVEPFDLEDPYILGLVIDKFYPGVTESGHRFPLSTPDEMKKFAKFVTQY